MRLILLFFASFFLFGCQKKEINTELPYIGDKLIVFCELNPEKIVSVYLNKTYPALGKFVVSQGLEGAKVDLLKDGIFVERLSYSDSGKYVSKLKIKPQFGSYYSFEVKMNNYPELTTQPVEIPSSVISPKVILAKDTISSTFSGEVARKLEVKWDDVESRKNYYLVSIDGQYENQFLLVNTFIVGKDGEVEDGCSFRRNRNRYIFQDACFSLQTMNVGLGLSSKGFLQNLNNSSTNARRDADSYKVSVSNISESYFRWLQDETQPEDILLAFQLPKNRFSNVNNGYGIVVASNTSTFYLNAK